jgi:SAM-dependent methyltransferase
MPNLLEVLQRSPRPEPWAEGEKIPWNEPGFSRRMLEVHLSQENDWASRRAGTIQKHVEWIHRDVLSGRPSRLLDLGCGPGLYTSALARLGHTCCGVDFSPASIAYARETARVERLACSYQLMDIRGAELGSDYDLVMFVFGEFNVFTPPDARLILQKAQAATRPGGVLLLEVHTFDTVHQMGEQPGSWYSSGSGLFSERPHLCLQENFWDEARSVATQRYFIVDAQSAQVSRFAASTQAYTLEQYQDLLKDCGYQPGQIFPSLTGNVDPSQPDFFAILAG